MIQLTKINGNKMRILIFNWRDINNPSGGGAEILTHEMASRWVARGHEVTQFSGEYPGCKATEKLDGVEIIRKGNPDIRALFHSVHWAAFLWYRSLDRSAFDVVIDEIHGIPFFTPWYTHGKKIALICEVANNLWYELFGRLIGFLGRTIEKYYLDHTYKRIRFLTISPSTEHDLITHGISKQNITVLPMGLTIPMGVRNATKQKNPTIIIVGRLHRSKGIEDAIDAVGELVSEYPNITLWIVGRGDKEYTDYLHGYVKTRVLTKNIQFKGFVSEKEKFHLLAQAHIVVSPSMKEGWGLTIPEAAYVGTPAVVYNSEGLRDVVKNGKTGIICDRNTSLELAKNIGRLLGNTTLYRKMQREAITLGHSYSWDSTAKVALDVIKSL